MNRGISIWKKDVELFSHPALQEDRCVDAAVIGGGMAGVLTACFLKDSGLKTILLEADEIGRGQTGNTTAKITSQHGLIYDRLIRQFGPERAGLYAAANGWAVEAYGRMIHQQRIDCNFTPCNSYLYTETDERALEQEYEAAEKLGLKAELKTGSGPWRPQEGEPLGLPFAVQAALCFPNQAHFHPLRFLQALAKHLEIYEHTSVRRVEGNRLYTEGHMVTADHIIFCTHYPFVNMPGFYFMRMHQERSYAIALEHAGKLKDLYYGIDQGALSLRPTEEYLIVSGGSHRTGHNCCGGQYEALLQAARRYWPDSRAAAAWSAQDCMPLDGVPYIGRFSRLRPNWYVATGFQKWGMTSSMAAVRILSDLILKGASPWEGIFSPQKRHMVSTPGKLCMELRESVKGLSKGLWTRVRSEKGSLEKAPVCSHMGCRLEWNPEEESWDCPCHGSRFDRDGKLLDQPALRSLCASQTHDKDQDLTKNP
ncbi:MAG: FAD-dependent oxidoreductase [Lachnospiraceae bacterium]|nr:FAD-dependent oxidoreductase [Lachnospiraceae bacterium]